MTANHRYHLGVMLGDGIGPEMLPALDGWLLGPHDSAANPQPGGQITSSQELLVEIHRPGDRPGPVAVPAYCPSARVFQNRCS
jgi:hypothetical protein